jgi:hypothetical protein
MDEQKDQQPAQGGPASPNGSQGGQMQVKVTDEILKGVYSNMVQVGHSPEEFILDFMNLFPPSGIVTSRVIVSPGHMKRIVAALEDNIKRYEASFGKIKASETPDHKIGFRTE